MPGGWRMPRHLPTTNGGTNERIRARRCGDVCVIPTVNVVGRWQCMSLWLTPESARSDPEFVYSLTIRCRHAGACWQRMMERMNELGPGVAGMCASFQR